METIVNIENLSIGYIHNQLRDVVAKNISFSLQKGQLTALVGANGIGKSTLLKNLSRIEKHFTFRQRLGQLQTARIVTIDERGLG